MRKLLQTILFDVIMAVVIVFFVYQFVMIARFDQYVVRKVIAHISQETELDTATIAFSYKFPFTVKARHIALGTRSMIGAVSVSVNPIELFINDTIRITEVKLEDTLVYYEDFSAIAKMITPKKNNADISSPMQFVADTIILKRVYVADAQGRYMRIDDGSLMFSSAKSQVSATCNTISGELYNGIQKIPYKISESRFAIDGEEINASLNMVLGGAQVIVNAMKNNGEYSGELRVSNVSLGLIHPDVRGVTSMSARISGKSKYPSLLGEMVLQDVGYKQTTLVNGKYNFSYSNDILALRDIAFNLGDTVFKGYITSTLRGETTVTGEFTVEHIRLSDLFHIPYHTDLAARLIINGKGRSWDDFKGTLDIADIQGNVQKSIINEGSCQIKKDGKLLTISSFTVKTDTGSLHGEGNVFGKNYSLALTMESLPLTLFVPAAEMNGTIDFRGVVTNDDNGLAATGVVTAQGVEWQKKKIGKLFASIAHSRDTTDVSVYLNDVLFAPIPLITTGKIEGVLTKKIASLRRCELYFSDTNVLKTTFSALREDNRWKSTDAHAEMQIGTKVITLTSEFSEVSDSGWLIHNASITDGISKVAANASRDEKTKKMEIHLNGMLDIGRINMYKKIFPDVEGQLSLAIDYSRDAENVQSKITFSMPLFVMVYENFSQTRFDSIAFEAEYQDNHYVIKDFSFSVAEIKNTFTGHVECDIKDTFKFRSFELHGDIKKMYSSFLVNFATSDVTVTDGFFSGYLGVLYDTSLKINADVNLFDTQLMVFDIGNAVIERLRGHAVVHNNRLVIHEIEGIANERGWVKMHGEIRDIIHDRFLDFTITFGGLYIPNVWYFSGFGAGTVKIFGKGKDELLSGDIEIDSGIWSAPFAVFSRSARKELSGINMNIRMRGANNIWWRNDSVNIEFDVDFFVKKVYVEGKTVLSGTMDAKKGTFYFLDVPFNVVKAQLVFANPEDISPDINLQGETDIFYRGKKRIILYVSGSLADPKITLMSDDPSLSQNDLLSLLAFNRPMNELENTGFMNEKAGEWATFYLQQRLLKPLKRSAMLDTLNVRGNLLSDNDRYLDVEVGKYLGNSFYLVYRNEMVRGKNQRFNVIYYINNNMSLETGAEEEKGEMKYNVDMKFKFKY